MEDRLEDALEWYTKVIDPSLEPSIGHAVRADALRGRGIVHQSRAEWAEAERDFLAARDAAAVIGDEGRIGRAENCLGGVAFERGNWFEAERRYGAARLSGEAAEDRDLLAKIENNVGTLLAARGESVQAEHVFRRALQHFDSLEQHPCGARVLNNLGLVLMKQGRHQEASAAYEKALADCKRRGDAMFATKILINQGRLWLIRQEPIQAHAAALKAWVFASRLGDGPVAAGARCLLGEVALGLRDYVGAIHHLRRALKLACHDKAPLVEAETWVLLGNLYEAQGMHDRARDTWRFARLCYQRLGAGAEAMRMDQTINRDTEAGEPVIADISRGRVALTGTDA